MELVSALHQKDMKHAYTHLPLAGFLLAIFCHPGLQAQGPNPLAQTLYYQVHADKQIQYTANFHLKGPVKSVLEVSADAKDTSVYQFNEKGVLLRSVAYSEVFHYDRILTDYSFDKEGRLYYMLRRDLEDGTTETDSFNTEGYLVHSRITSPSSTEIYPATRNYVYTADHSQVSVFHEYAPSGKSWDLLRKEVGVFGLDKHHRLLSEYRQSTYTDARYGNTVSFLYDTLLNLPVVVSSKDDCSSEDFVSCPNLMTVFQYDKQGRLIQETCTDLTIRNTYWNNGYRYTAKYNKDNELLRQHYSREDDRKAAKNNSSEEDPSFVYEHDAHGNWIRKYSLIKDKRTLVSIRTLEYF